MNNLSWFLYLADVLSNVGFLFVCIGVIGMTIAAILVLCAVIVDEMRREAAIKFLKWCVGVFCSCLALLFLATLIPSKETMYAIAASELGEEALKTPTANKAIKALDAWLDKQIKENTNEDRPQHNQAG